MKMKCYTERVAMKLVFSESQFGFIPENGQKINILKKHDRSYTRDSDAGRVEY
jgi:hypothetical protein